MSNEKQTDTGNWKNKLSDLDGLPGEGFFNKDAAWESLHGRLHKKPVRKAIWYWAAACLLPVILLLWMTNNKKETVVVTANPTQQNKVAPVSRPPFDHKEITVVSLPLPIVKTSVLTNENNARKVAVVNKSVRLKTTQFPVAIVIPETMPVVIRDIIPPADTVVANIASVTKKISVVHINELETTTEVPATAIRRTQKNFRIMFNKIKSNNTTASATQQYGGVKIPLTN